MYLDCKKTEYRVFYIESKNQNRLNYKFMEKHV